MIMRDLKSFAYMVPMLHNLRDFVLFLALHTFVDPCRYEQTLMLLMSVPVLYEDPPDEN